MANALHKLIQEAAQANETPVEVSFARDLERVVVLCNTKKSKNSTLSYKPSSMQCLRRMYYQATGTFYDEAQDKTCSGYGIGDSGTDRHKRVQRYITKMKEHGIDCEYISVGDFIKERGLTHVEVFPSEYEDEFETLVYIKDLNIRLKCDGIIKYHGKYYVFEFKTEISGNWQQRTQVSPNHIIQACNYSYAFGLDNVMFLYENRDLCSWKPYTLHVTQGMREEYVVNRIKVCNLYVAEKRIPPIFETQVKEVCKYCDYKKTCRKDGQTSIMEVEYSKL